MMSPDSMTAETLDCELRVRLMRISRLRVVVRALTAVVYAAVLCWIAYGLYHTFGGSRAGQVLSEDAWMFVAGGFVVFLGLHLLWMCCLVALKKKETGLMRQALRQLFPEAVYAVNGTISRSMLENSAFFRLFCGNDATADFTKYGSILFRGEHSATTIYDLGVTSGRLSGILSRLPVVGLLPILYRLLVRPLFGAPVENSLHSFRGMFGMHSGCPECKGCVLLLPDRLERKIGYLAHTIQAYRRQKRK